MCKMIYRTTIPVVFAGILLGHFGGYQGVVMAYLFGIAVGIWYVSNFHEDGRFRMIRNGE